MGTKGGRARRGGVEVRISTYLLLLIKQVTRRSTV